MKEAYTKTVGVDDPLSFSPAGARFSIGFVELSASSEKHPQTIVFLRRPKGPCQCCCFPFAFSPTSLFEPANLTPKSIARLRTPAGVRFSHTAIGCGVLSRCSKSPQLIIILVQVERFPIAFYLPRALHALTCANG